VADGKLFHSREVAAGNARSPRVDHRTGGIIGVVDIDELRW